MTAPHPSLAPWTRALAACPAGVDSTAWEEALRSRGAGLPAALPKSERLARALADALAAVAAWREAERVERVRLAERAPDAWAARRALADRPAAIPVASWCEAVVALVDAPGWTDGVAGRAEGHARAYRISRAVAHLLDVAGGRRPTGCCPRPTGCAPEVDALFGRYDRGEWMRARRPRAIRAEPSPIPAETWAAAALDAAGGRLGELATGVAVGSGVREAVAGELRAIEESLRETARALAERRAPVRAAR